MCHCHIDFIGEPPVQNYVPKELTFWLAESTGVDFEIDSFLVRNIIVPATHCPGEYMSTIFARPKPSGRYRIILNLSKLNENVSYKHFKMESLASALNLVTQSCVMLTMDLKDSIPVAIEHGKYLRFTWRNQSYVFTRVPNGLACALRLYTKIMKPVFSSRSHGFLSVSFIDDILLIRDGGSLCISNMTVTLEIVQNLGFSIMKNQGGSRLVKNFLGFMLDSVNMSLQSDKIAWVIGKGKALLKPASVEVLDLASYVGILVSCFLALLMAQCIIGL